MAKTNNALAIIDPDKFDQRVDLTIDKNDLVTLKVAEEEERLENERKLIKNQLNTIRDALVQNRNSQLDEAGKLADAELLDKVKALNTALCAITKSKDDMVKMEDPEIHSVDQGRNKANKILVKCRVSGLQIDSNTRNATSISVEIPASALLRKLVKANDELVTDQDQAFEALSEIEREIENVGRNERKLRAAVVTEILKKSGAKGKALLAATKQ